MARYVSFRFDDGFITGARTAASYLAPHRGTFFLITDLVCGGAADHCEPLFKGRDFGSPAEWRTFAQAGHDLQLHGRTHTNMTLLPADEQHREISDSLALTRALHEGPYVFCHPFNARADLDFETLGIAGAGFETRSSDQLIIFHSLTGPVDPFTLTSWAVRERHFDTIVEQLGQLPDQSWVILAFHSLNGEGHEPWSETAFGALVAMIGALDMIVVTIAEMIDRLSLV